eukprot:3337455-Pleurochrysis_carterae.AAC.1
MSKEESRLKRLPSSSVPSTKKVACTADCDVRQEMRTRAAVVAAELKEANAVDAVAWPARLDSRWANRLATLVLCNVAPAET